MKILIFALLTVFLILNVDGHVVKRQSNTEISDGVEGNGPDVDSRFGLSDIKDFANTAGKKIKTGAKKVGQGIEHAADSVKEGFLSGYDYIKRKIKPNKDGLDYAIDVRREDENEEVRDPTRKFVDDRFLFRFESFGF
jgi:hypothetical protein